MHGCYIHSLQLVKNATTMDQHGKDAEQKHNNVRRFYKNS